MFIKNVLEKLKRLISIALNFSDTDSGVRVNYL